MDAFDSYHSGRPDALTWLQGWFVEHCDGDWEHGDGITIESLDNPGWSVAIEIRYTELADRPFARREVHRSQDDWLAMWVENGKWHLACGPLNLGEGLHHFRVWTSDIAAPD